MGNMLATVIVWSLGTFTARLFSALGVSLVSYSALSELVDELIDYIEPLFGRLPADVVSILSIAGVGQGMTLIVSALMTRAVFVSAQAFLHVVK